MIYKCFAVIGVLMLLSVTAHAGPAPRDLYGKSITVQWSESSTGKWHYEQVATNTGSAHQMNIYVSTAGRPFVRMIGTGIGGVNYHTQQGGQPSSKSESAPGQSDAKDRVDFQGRSIVAYREFQSGARRIAIEFEGASSTCKATVTIGKQTGSNVVTRSGGFGTREVSSVQIGSTSCSIREGNVFGQ
jgi:hypothetical protein